MWGTRYSIAVCSEPDPAHILVEAQLRPLQHSMDYLYPLEWMVTGKSWIIFGHPKLQNNPFKKVAPLDTLFFRGSDPKYSQDKHIKN